MSKRRSFEEKVVDDKVFRYSETIDEQSRAFEAKLREKRYRTSDECVDKAIEIGFFQSHEWLEAAQFEYRLLQISSQKDGEPLAQFVVRIERPKRLSNCGRAFLLGYSQQSVDGPTEELGLRWLKQRLTDEKTVMDFRLQPYQLNRRSLQDFHARARRAGFDLIEQQGVTRTLIYDLKPTVEEQLAAFSAKTRAKLKPRFYEMCVLRDLSDSSQIDLCQAALNASMNRTGVQHGFYDFKTLFALKAKNAERVKILGLSLAHRPDEMLAFVTAFSHGKVIEYSAAGSHADAELRKIPFNYMLVWELMKWGKSVGGEVFDLGGVTDGDPSDRLAGISDFKRAFTEDEHEIGKESYVILNSMKYRLFRAATRIRKKQ